MSLANDIIDLDLTLHATYYVIREAIRNATKDDLFYKNVNPIKSVTYYKIYYDTRDAVYYIPMEALKEEFN